MNNVVEMQLPASETAERAVLGAILLDGHCLAETDVLTPAHFSLDSHRRIYAHLVELWQEGIAPDPATLIELLRERKQLEAVGGASYVASLTDSVPRTNLDYQIKIINEKAQLRDIIIQSQKAISRALNQDKPGAILEDLNTEAVRIAADTHVKEQDIFLGVSKFIRRYNEGINWRVEGAIEVGTNGMLMGMSGDAKSPAARALAVCLASGLPWLELPVKRCRTALVSREDYAGTTARFIEKFIRGNGIDEQKFDLDHWLYVNSRAQIPSLLLDKPADLRLLINNLKRRNIEFCILDVLNVLHSADENDNTEMRKVLRAIDHIRDEVGCQVMVLHHTRKGVEDDTAIAESGRGSSAIAGFAEFKIRVRTVNEEAGIRNIRFKTKAGEGAKGFFWEIKDNGPNEVTLERNLEWTPTKGTQQRPQMTM